ncbi:hypothetical protein [Streptomyces thermolilacinus]|uniref:Uncharacterized protein n=1 Tax=Streptomyces thermolilacinus SPC6 TaxID=1306406 RepID=A0A1D3DN32_9ACTN|nr:hypothetical protein [Streptomyces thermolilacinus]OEJ93726.1 hypothetical protein J116_003825 [Streptomyces thermolilacinus SPC6]
MFRRQSVLVLRDAPEILQAVRAALADAEPHERAGLGRALTLVEAQCARTDGELRGRWVDGVLGAAGVDVEDQVKAVAAVRRAAADLGLSQAVDLVREAREHASA